MRLGRGRLDSSFQVGTAWEMWQSSKPTTRPDASALTAGDRWYDTSDNFYYFWNGTYWLSEQIYSPTIPNTNTSSNTIDFPVGSYNHYLLNFSMGGYWDAPQNGSNYRVVTLYRRDSGTGGGFTSITSVNTSALNLSSGRYVGVVTSSALNTLVTTSTLGIYEVSLDQSGSPGGFINSLSLKLRYRLAKP